MERVLRNGLLGFGALVAAMVAARPLLAPADPAAEAGERRAMAVVADPAHGTIDYRALDARLQRLMAEPAMVGLAVAVVEKGRITFIHGYGETLHGSGDKVTPATVFRWASVSKGVAGTLVAKLAEQRKLDLDAPVARYGSTLRLPDGGENIATLRDLMSHRVGLYHNAYDNKLEEGTPAPVLRQQLQMLSAGCRPGTCWAYQNVAYDASSEIVARATGLAYADAARRMLFDPLGMTSASMTRAGLEGAKSWARGHDRAKRPITVNDIYYGVPAAGGVNSDIKDLALWMIAQAGGAPDVISPAVRAALHEPLVFTPSEVGRLRKFRERLKDPRYGLGWRSYDYAGHRIVGHRGGVNGYRSLVLFDPATKSGVVALWNANTTQPGGLEFEVMDRLYGLEHRDWLEIDGAAAAAAAPAAEDGANAG